MDKTGPEPATLGKPIGIGGNPVSCAIGLAVLDTIACDRLQDHALGVGRRQLSGFEEFRARHEVIGDVRGQDLFLRVELVADRETREPAPRVLAAAIERARDAGVLLSCDGPDHNVLKIKPPMPFAEANADLMLSVFDRSFAVTV